jgi:hypothetical protein
MNSYVIWWRHFNREAVWLQRPTKWENCHKWWVRKDLKGDDTNIFEDTMPKIAWWNWGRLRHLENHRLSIRLFNDGVLTALVLVSKRMGMLSWMVRKGRNLFGSSSKLVSRSVYTFLHLTQSASFPPSKGLLTYTFRLLFLLLKDRSYGGCLCL